MSRTRDIAAEVANLILRQPGEKFIGTVEDMRMADQRLAKRTVDQIRAAINAARSRPHLHGFSFPHVQRGLGQKTWVVVDEHGAPLSDDHDDVVQAGAAEPVKSAVAGIRNSMRYLQYDMDRAVPGSPTELECALKIGQLQSAVVVLELALA